MTHLSPSQSRAARALLNMTQMALADAACVSISTLVAFELGRRDISASSKRGIAAALEAAGVEILHETPEHHSGVALKATLLKPDRPAKKTRRKKVTLPVS